MAFPLAFLALIVERGLGYPGWLVRAIGHPVTWIGALIAMLDRRLNRETATPLQRRAMGVLALIFICLAAGTASWVIIWLLGPTIFGLIAAALVASSLIAQKSLEEHVLAVSEALHEDGVEAGRKAVSQIVGRDPEALDEAGVARAAIESLAENFSDGVVAPAFWLALLGLPGAAIYKAVNTADSMIGHKTERHADFGWAAARFDDLINLPASRLTALMIVAAAAITRGADARAAARAVRRDAPLHRSPNAGWPEAAMAGALGVRLGGPVAYDGVAHDRPWMGEGAEPAGAADIARALRLYLRATALLWLVVGARAWRR